MSSNRDAVWTVQANTAPQTYTAVRQLTARNAVLWIYISWLLELYWSEASRKVWRSLQSGHTAFCRRETEISKVRASSEGKTAGSVKTQGKVHTSMCVWVCVPYVSCAWCKWQDNWSSRRDLCRRCFLTCNLKEGWRGKKHEEYKMYPLSKCFQTLCLLFVQIAANYTN